MKFKLDIEDALFDFEGWAFVHFHTTLPCHVLADLLNRLYHYGLRRVNDMPMADAVWPFYRYEDPVRHLIVFLAERPAGAATAPWEAGDKLCVLKGETADEEASCIQSDFTTQPRYDDGDLLARERAALLDRLLANFTVANRLDFDVMPASRKAQKDRLLVMQQCDSILAYIEQNHLDLDREELMRMELIQQLKKKNNLSVEK